MVEKLDHLTCSKCLFMTLLYNMYKPINYISVYSQNCVTNGPTFEILNGIFAKFPGLLPNG